MIKRLIAIAIFIFFFPQAVLAGGDGPTPLLKGKHNKHVMALKADLLNGRLAERTNIALDILLAVAVNKLKREGFEFEAEKIKKEWQENWFGYIVRVRDIGDHDPMSEWLAVTYFKIESLLGPDLMAWLHLDDLWVLNHAIPVLFKPCSLEWDKVEYKKHFVPACSVFAYWGTMIPCMVFTTGLGTFFCSPGAMLSENLMKKFIAPGLSDRVYEASCERITPVESGRYSILWDEPSLSNPLCKDGSRSIF